MKHLTWVFTAGFIFKYLFLLFNLSGESPERRANLLKQHSAFILETPLPSSWSLLRFFTRSAQLFGVNNRRGTTVPKQRQRTGARQANRAAFLLDPRWFRGTGRVRLLWSWSVSRCCTIKRRRTSDNNTFTMIRCDLTGCNTWTTLGPWWRHESDSQRRFWFWWGTEVGMRWCFLLQRNESASPLLSSAHVLSSLLLSSPPLSSFLSSSPVVCSLISFGCLLSCLVPSPVFCSCHLFSSPVLSYLLLSSPLPLPSFLQSIPHFSSSPVLTYHSPQLFSSPLLLSSVILLSFPLFCPFFSPSLPSSPPRIPGAHSLPEFVDLEAVPASVRVSAGPRAVNTHGSSAGTPKVSLWFLSITVPTRLLLKPLIAEHEPWKTTARLPIGPRLS